MLLKGFTFILMFLVQGSVSLNILGVFPYYGKSHMMVFEKLLKGLADKGHNLTVISQFPQKDMPENYRDIVIDKTVELQTNSRSIREISGRWFQYLSAYILSQMAKSDCERLYNTKEVQYFINKLDKMKFDVILTEFFNSDCFFPIFEKLNAPVVGISSCYMMPWIEVRMANPPNPAYVPNHFLDQSDTMLFMDRVETTVATVLHNLFYYNFMLKQDEEIARKHIKDFEPISSSIRKTSLIIVNTHFSLNFPRPLVPNIIEVGGIHLEMPKPLSEDLEEWVSGSPNGVVYFSMGSMLIGSSFPEEKRLEFVKAFKRIPQRVLWKWENNTMPGKPDNVKTGKWMPQLDILCHPNVKAFVSHGGLLGTIEAVYCGVPIIVMPQYGDQFVNAKVLEKNGGGVILYLEDATEETLYAALQKVLSPEFQKQAKELSERFKDRPLSPMDTAIYWVEYVARHKGAHFMKTAAVGMPFYKYYLLDVISFLIAVFAILIYIIYKAMKAVFVCLTCFKSKSKKKSE